MDSSHVWMWQLDHKESRVLKNQCFQTVVLEKTLESPLNCKEIKPVSLKGNQSWLLTVRTDAEAEAPIFGHLMQRADSLKRLWGRREKGIRGWDSWMTSSIQWIWTWANSGRWWGSGSPGGLQSMGLWRVGHNLATEQ